MEAGPRGGAPRPRPLLLLLQLLGLSLRGVGTGSAGRRRRRRRHGVLRARTGLGAGAVTVNERQLCSVGGRGGVHVSAGEGGWGPLAATGLTSGGAGGGLLRSPLGKGPSPGGEPELVEGPRGAEGGSGWHWPQLRNLLRSCRAGA